MALSQAIIEEIRGAMSAKSGAQARGTAKKLAREMEISETSVYRHSRELRREMKRSNRGVRKIKIEDEILGQMESVTIQAQLPATDVVEIFEQNRLIEPGAISPAWLTRHLRQRQMSRRQAIRDPRPCRRFEASEPGELMQIDCTVAEQFYIEDDGSVGWESSASKNKNRAGNQKPRLILFAAEDDYSRANYAEFMAGQTTNHWLNFEFNCFRKKQDPRFIFHGIPRMIYMDNDAVSRNPKFVRAHLALGIGIKKHAPTRKNDLWSNARSKGKIERLLGWLAQKQKRTKLQKFKSLDEANQWLFEVCLQKNLARHSTTKEVPFQRWIKIRPEMLIICEEDRLYEILYRDISQRQVYRDMTIHLDGDVWQLPFELPFLDMVGQAVIIYRHPLEQSRIYLEWQGREYLVEKHDQTFRAWADGPRQLPKTTREREIEQAMGMDLSHLQLWGFDQGPAENMVYLPMKEGVALDTSRLIPEPPRQSRLKALRIISDRLGRPLRREENILLTGILAEQVTDQEIEAAFEKLAQARAAESRVG